MFEYRIVGINDYRNVILFKINGYINDVWQVSYNIKHRIRANVSLEPKYFFHFEK